MNKLFSVVAVLAVVVTALFAGAHAEELLDSEQPLRQMIGRPVIFDFPPGYFGKGGKQGANFKLINPFLHPANPLNLSPFNPNPPQVSISFSLIHSFNSAFHLFPTHQPRRLFRFFILLSVNAPCLTTYLSTVHCRWEL